MRQVGYLIAAVPFLMFGPLTNLVGQTHSMYRPHEKLMYATGTLKSFTNDAIALAQARDVNNVSSRAADMTFVITRETNIQGRERAHENAIATVSYVEQNGKLIARNVYFQEKHRSRYH